MLIDTHCHLTSSALAAQLDDVLARAAAAGVTRVLTVAVSLADAQAALELLDTRPQVSLIAGIHPHEAAKCTEDDFAGVAAWHRGEALPVALRHRLVAVGEIGLDFHYDFAPRPRQEEVFTAQLELACEVDRPVVIHARDAEGRVCEILARFPGLAGRVVFHCFSADAHVARRVLNMGFWLSFTGMVTFQKAAAVRAAAGLVPRDRLMIETDAPYLAPEPVRHVRPNEPAFVVHTARYLAALRGESFESFAAATTANACRFFHLPEVTS